MSTKRILGLAIAASGLASFAALAFTAGGSFTASSTIGHAVTTNVGQTANTAHGPVFTTGNIGRIQTTTPLPGQAGQGLLINNGNGTSTLISPGGATTTVPSPK